ncbi:TetR/AcrR family transcriptional regulator [Streptomyces sp. NBC_01261]|uniref:TetR/AcrR family transcriptional regulator n=1 Tax=unclassified Streptomyces TaxID=2593676 RepID=UPI002E3740D5|nr:TetR/AcrR family transcriptional regulator [Streptomyces sp. NBC_01261]
MAVKGCPRTGAPRGKREIILDAAVEVFLARGFDQTSMDAVAAQAGVSKTTVYAHFGDKVELFRSVIERGASYLDFDLDQAMLSSVDDPEERLVRIILKLLEATTSPQYLALVRVMATETVRRPELTAALHSLGSPHVIDVVATTLQEDAHRHGYTLPDASAYAVLFTRMAAAGLQMDALLDPEADQGSARLLAHARWTTALFLRALRALDAGDLPDTPALTHIFPWTPSGTT